MDVIASSDMLSEVLKNKYGNYVLDKAFEVASQTGYQKLCYAVKMNVGKV